MKPTNPLVGALLTDMYQVSMAYAYWKNGMQDNPAVFDLFFRKCPFAGEFAVFAGLEEVLRFVENYKIEEDDIEYLKKLMPDCEPEFFDWLGKLDCSEVKIYAPPEGTIMFPKVPLLRVEGPLAIVQLLETTLLNQINFATLMATNAAHFRLAAGPEITLLEFGLRRAQGADGAITAARSAYIGGFDGTSNVLAGKLFGIPVKGTHAHSFVLSFKGRKCLKTEMIKSADGSYEVNLWEEAKKVLTVLGYTETNDGELASFIAYAQAFPNGFLALVDTYDTLKSGIPNFIAVGTVLFRIGYSPKGFRLDSGDLAYYSIEGKAMIERAEKICGVWFKDAKGTASNDIEKQVIYSLKEQGHKIDAMGIGTHLVTCKEQPALGGVYKEVELNDSPRIKLSNDAMKVTLPGRKRAFRLHVEGRDYPVVDLIMMTDEGWPEVGKRILCHNIINPLERSYITPTEVCELHEAVWMNGCRQEEAIPTSGIRNYVMEQLAEMRPDHLRPVNPTPYKIAMSEKVNATLRALQIKETPIGEIK